MSQLIIPFFITHQGCPHRCSFCNQEPVTSLSEQHSQSVNSSDVASEINTWLFRSKKRRTTQVAFYGGSFTGLSEDRQIELLEAVQPFISEGKVDSIRLSTRPDYVSPKTPSFLKHFNVDTVEIGVQSLDQNVLDANARGHTINHIETSIHILKDAGLYVGAQLLLGLPEETSTSAIRGAKKLTQIKPHFVRLYPALVLKGSALEGSYNKGYFKPLSLLRAVALSARIKEILEKSSIPVTRIGLQPSTELKNNVIAGPYHPALGELVLSRLFFKRIRNKLSNSTSVKQINASALDQSIIYGQKKSSLNRLKKLGLLNNTTFNFSKNIPRGVLEFV